MIDVESGSEGADRTMVEMEEFVAAGGFEVERGACIGRYVALRLLGAGGMGVVWAAWDPELDREVAIKVLGRRFRAGPKARGRLLREAQAMARLDHPNIVAVHDVGVVANQVFVAMEYVRGQTLREWTRAQTRSWGEIVEVYCQAALGLGAAHEAGLVHRDFKPDNAMIDERGRVRVMDFGLAAAYANDGSEESAEGAFESWGSEERDPLMSARDVHGSASDLVRSGVLGDDESLEHSSDLLATPMTEVGAILGTPAYMSPEQIKGRRGDPASDQFALCVALWQALFGKRPYPGDSVGELWASLEAEKLRKPPAKARVPKRVLSTLARGLAFDPSQRWPSMQSLADQLSPRPVRRSAAWIVAGAVVLAVGGIAATSLLEGRRLEACEDPEPHFSASWNPESKAQIQAALAEAGSHGSEAWARVEPAVDAWVDTWMGVWAHGCRGSEGLPESLQVARAVCLERGKDRFEATLEVLHEADGEVTARAFDMILQLPAPDVCADAERLAARVGLYATGSAKLREVQQAMAKIEALREAGRQREALALLDTLGPALEAANSPALKIEELAARGGILLSLDRHADALEQLREAYRAAVVSGDDEAAAKLSTQMILAHEGLAQTEAARGWELHAQAFEARSDAGAIQRADRLAALALVADNAGEYERALGLFAEVEQLLAEELGPESLRVARILDEYGGTYGRLGRLDEAVAVQERSLEIVVRELGPAHPEVGGAHLALGNTCYRKDELDQARTHFERALAIVEPSLGPAHFAVTGALTGLGAIALAEQQDLEAAAFFRSAVERIEVGFGLEHPNLVPPLVNLGIALKRGEDYVGAEASEQRALALLEQLHGPEHPNLLSILDNLGEIAVLRGEFGLARDHYARSLAIGELSFGAEHPELDYALVGLGDAMLEEGDAEGARVHYARVLAHREVEGKNLGLVADATFGLARLEFALGNEAPALERARAARTVYEGMSRPDVARLAEIEAWITRLENSSL